MEKFTNCIGIDVSKEKIDAHDYKLNKHYEFNNDLKGYQKLLDWVVKNHANQEERTVFCFENTGIYSMGLCVFMQENKLAYSQVSGLEISKSAGITRGKSDQTDAWKIAQYGYYRKDELTLTSLPADELLQLKELVNLRERMVKQRSGYQAHLKELRRFAKREKRELLFASQEKMIEELSEQIKTIEKEMERLIEETAEIKKNYQLATSVKGVGLILGISFLVNTNNFTKFETWREFASHAGIAPFDHQSGSSIKGGKRVSSIGNKRMKALLSNAAVSNIQYDPEMRLYYQKRIKEGKPKMQVQNIIRNKIVARVFATVKRGTPYVDIASFAA
jgi:transposase